MLLVSSVSLTGSLMLIHYSVVCAVDTGKLKLPPLKRKSKKHHDSFSPIAGITQLHQKKHFLGNLCVVSSHAFPVSARILPFLKITYPGTHTSPAASVSGGGEESCGMAVPGCQDTSHPHPLTSTEEMILCVFTHYVRAQLTILWELGM